MELFDYYKRKGKFKLLIGTGIFILALCAVYDDWGYVNWGQIIFLLSLLLSFWNWILAGKKRGFDTKEYGEK